MSDIILETLFPPCPLDIKARVGLGHVATPGAGGLRSVLGEGRSTPFSYQKKRNYMEAGKSSGPQLERRKINTAEHSIKGARKTANTNESRCKELKPKLKLINKY